MAGSKHLIIPDTQVKPGVSTKHFPWIAEYAADKRPDVIVHLGDHWDLPSLSSYDKGKKAAEGRRLQQDLDSGKRAMDILNERWSKVRGWNPRRVITLGNHENRLNRHIEASPELDGLEQFRDPFGLEAGGWEVHEFLKPVTIDGVMYCHFFPANAQGKIMQTKNGAPNARAQVQRQLCSCTAGHTQGLDVAIQQTPRGMQRGIVAGSCYTHNESYIGPAENQNYWRGILMKHEVKRGNYNLLEVSLDWLKRKFG